MKRAANPTPDQVEAARGAIMRFSVENPLVVGPSVHRQLLSYPELADLMDRVIVSQPLPTEPAP